MLSGLRFLRLQVRDISDNPMAKRRSGRRRDKDEQDASMETRILERCVRKILALLVIGFGEAGSEVCAACCQLHAAGLLPGTMAVSRPCALPCLWMPACASRDRAGQSRSVGHL